MRKNRPRISVVVPTRNRPDDLNELLQCLYRQRRRPFQLIIVDGSPMGSAKVVFDSFRPRFKSKGCRLSYVKGGYDGLTAARNLGVKYVKGDAVLFLDDDTLLDENVIDALVKCLQNDQSVLGVQTNVIRLMEKSDNAFARRLWNATSKALMLTYKEKNRMSVRRSVERIVPSSLTKVIPAQALSGCSCCYRRVIFDRFRFDTNLKRSAYLEDLDFSYRVYKAYPHSLFAIPGTTVLHKASPQSRLPVEATANMDIVYRFYVFFKIFSNESILNLPVFLWAQVGRLLKETLGLLIEGKSITQCWALIYLLRSYLLALKHLRSIRARDLGFFNDHVISLPQPSMGKLGIHL